MAFFAGLLIFSLLFRDMQTGAAIMFILIGGMHLVKPRKLTYMIEGWLPYAYALVIITGVFEIIGGAALLFEATRHYAALGLAALLICMFPANIRVAVKGLPAPGGLPAKPWYTWSRLLFQPVYILWLFM